MIITNVSNRIKNEIKISMFTVTSIFFHHKIKIKMGQRRMGIKECAIICQRVGWVRVS